MDKNLELLFELRDEITPINNAALRGLDSRNADFVLPSISESELSVLDNAVNILNRINSDIENAQEGK